MAGRRQGSGSAKNRLLALAMATTALLVAIQGAMAATYTVGGTSGWQIGPSYSTWAAQYTFQVGDTLVFNYNPELHSVFQVDEANFKACNLFPTIKTYQSGSDSVTLTENTPYYFVCGTPGHCGQGMALAITIGGSKQSTPSPAPVATPAPPIAPTPSSAPPVASPAPASTNTPIPLPSPTSPSPSEAMSPSTSPSSSGPPSEAPGSSKNAASTLRSGTKNQVSTTLILAGIYAWLI